MTRAARRRTAHEVTFANLALKVCLQRVWNNFPFSTPWEEGRMFSHEQCFAKRLPSFVPGYYLASRFSGLPYRRAAGGVGQERDQTVGLAPLGRREQDCHRSSGHWLQRSIFLQV